MTTTEPDQTLFYVLIALMVTLIVLVIVGVVVMCMCWPGKAAKGGYVEPDEEEDHKRSPVFGSKGMK